TSDPPARPGSSCRRRHRALSKKDQLRYLRAVQGSPSPRDQARTNTSTDTRKPADEAMHCERLLTRHRQQRVAKQQPDRIINAV
ncbi:MAG: hypothetical protein WKF96_11735, partial [Solirubrobacteraceae bacterium]